MTLLPGEQDPLSDAGDQDAPEERFVVLMVHSAHREVAGGDPDQGQIASRSSSAGIQPE